VTAWSTLDGAAPRVIAHRGASGYRPEHTLEGYALAAEQGADAIEPDVVVSRDGVSYARHDVGLARSTDIAAHGEMAARARKFEGSRDWWISDFAAEEIDRLRAVQPIPSRGTRFDGQFAVPRLAQVLEFARRVAREPAAPLVVDVEIKSPAFFERLGINVLAALYRDLEQCRMTGPDAPVWLECFDHAFLRRAFDRCGNPCFALFEAMPETFSERDAVLRDLASWAKGIAPAKQLLRDDSGLVAAAHAAGLEVHVWTFRDDRVPEPFADARDELFAAFALGVDAVFCDFPDTAAASREAYARAIGESGIASRESGKTAVEA
jgi:glycerophosphoryl diester phosphodiesterase